MKKPLLVALLLLSLAGVACQLDEKAKESEARRAECQATCSIRCQTFSCPQGTKYKCAARLHKYCGCIYVERTCIPK